MKKTFLFIIFTIFCLLATSCYPGDVKTNTPINDLATDNIANDVAPEDFLHSNNEKLHIQITEDEVIKANRTIALSGKIATVRPWNMDAIMKLFDDEIDSERKIDALPVDAKNYHIYNLHGNGILNCYDGFLFYSKTKRADTIYSVYFDDFSEYITPKRLKSIYSGNELSDFPVEDAKKIVQDYIQTLDIPVNGEPYVFAMDVDSISKIRDDAILQTGDEEGYPEWTKEDEAYRFCYQLSTDSMPLLCYPLIGGDDKGYYREANLSIVVAKNGVMVIECKGVMDIKPSSDSEIAVCTADTALSVVKENIESTVVTKETTLENIYFGYGMKFIDDFTYELIPMYFIGSYSLTNTTTADGLKATVPISIAHFVSAETAKEF